jgi:biopolymer transport protein ExbD
MKKFNSINIIPFVDIMLVLLAIVLITSTFIDKKVMPINLPKSNAKSSIKKSEIFITVTKEGEIFFNNKKVSKKELLSKIESLQVKSVVNINCDKETKFDNFVFILNALKQKGLNNIFLVTKQND